MSYIDRSLPRADRDEPQAEVPTAEVRTPEPVTPRPVYPEPELLDCGHCGDVHGPEPCATALHDRAAELLAELRQRGAIVSLREDGATVNVKGYQPDPETVAVLKAMKPVVVAILQAEGRP